MNELFIKIGVKQKFRGTEDMPYRTVIDYINMVPLEKSLKKTQSKKKRRNMRY